MFFEFLALGLDLMRRPPLTRLPLGRLMLLIVLLALGLTFVRHSFLFWGPTEITVAVYVLLLIATLAAWGCGPRWKTILITFLISSWTYLIVSRMPEGTHLPTTTQLHEFHDRFHPPGPTQDWDDPFARNRSLPVFMEAGHALFGLLFGLLGGLLAMMAAPRNDRRSFEGFPADGRLLKDGRED